MRLRLVIQRHSLPSVQIVYTTGTGPASHTKSRDSTIADLLHDVNDLVPLESADGEWGLEDYVVEVVPAFDKTAAYECLHFQTCEAVLREDDEVVIRALSSEELRIRRLGGRHQIAGDGRHLIDGVAFGKQWLRKGSRPGLVIPPRKRRRLLHTSAEDNGDDEVRQILPPPSEDHSTALVPATGGEEDEDEDEEDEDYVDNPLQVAVSADFDDADVESADASEPSEGDGELQSEDLSAEVKLLLEDAAELQKVGDDAAAQKVVGRQLKRKRDVDDEGEISESATFEGFSTPARGSKHVPISDGNDADTDSDGDSMLRDIAEQQAEKRAKNIVEDDEDDEDDEDVEDSSESDASSSSDAPSSPSATDSMMEDLAMQQAKKRVLNLIQASDVESSNESDYTTSSSEGETDDDETSSSGSDSESGSESDDGSESDADSDTSSSSSSSSQSDSESSSEVDKKKNEVKKPSASAPGSASGAQPPALSPGPAKPPTVPPGGGTGKTHNNNSRVKKRRKLNFLKEQGILPKDADFRALAAYEAAQENKGTEQTGSEEQEQPTLRDLPVQSVGEVQQTVTAGSVDGDTRIESRSMADDNFASTTDNEVASTAGPSEMKQPEAQPDVESAPKRARLDLASSRRMLFSSLGLRTPKTPEAEQALREKLSKSVRPARKSSGPSAESGLRLPPTEATAESDDSWKEKLIITAVECEQQGGVLPPPPFPFQQSWTKTSSDKPAKSKRRARDQAQFYEDYEGQPQENQEDAYAPDVSMLVSGDVHQPDVVDGSKSTVGAHEISDDIPIPAAIDDLPDLDQASILPGAVIAYKELHVDASTNYQPEVSSYRVGRVSRMDEDGNVHLTLARSCLEAASKPEYDEETGQRVYGKFELPLSDDADAGPDDGVREILFSSMISPKLVASSSVEVPDSNKSSGLRGGDASDEHIDEQYAAIPETVQRGRESSKSEDSQTPVDDIATPRRNEISNIIKEAGFNSALDEQLLQPVSIPSAGHEQTGSPVPPQDHAQGEYPGKLSNQSPRVNVPPSSDKAASDLNEDDDDNNRPGAANTHVFSAFEQSSSSFMHIHETVEYPHISEIELTSSGPLLTTNSSSHQDAQKVSPALPVELSFTASDQQDSGNEADVENTELADHDGHENPTQQQDSFEALGSEVPQSQSQAVSFESFEEEGTHDDADRPDSFLDRGYDGHDSSYHEDDAVSENDSDDLPSILEIASGRSQYQGSRPRSKKETSQPTRRSARNSMKVQNSTPPSSPDLPPSSQPVVKLSQSQQEPRLSQIPVGSQVVDLTFSSSPQKDDEEFSIGTKKGASQNKGNKMPTSKATKQDSGVGKRRLLTTKKTKS